MAADCNQEPGPDGCLPGMSNTDKFHNLVDDGLERKYKCMTQQEADLSASLNYLSALVSAASAERLMSRLLLLIPPSASKNHFLTRLFPSKRSQPHAAYMQVIRCLLP